MLQSALYIKLAAMAAALGLDTADWKNPSTEMVSEVTKLEKAQAAALDPKNTNRDDLQKQISDSITAIKALADKGDKDALFSLGLILQNQQGGIEQAVAYYKQAADKGQLQAMNNYGFILVAAAQRDEAKQKEGVEWIKRASDAGSNPARRNMAQFYVNGLAGQKKDPDAAKKLLEAAYADKDYQAAYDLSQFYAGAGGAVDDEKTWDWLNNAAKGGNPSGLDTLGSLLLNGGSVGKKVIAKDADAAVKQFQDLANQNNAVGLRKLGGLYEDGTIGKVAKDFKKALEYYTKAAQGNDGIAQFRLASIYDTGYQIDDKEGVARNDALALNLYRLAAQNKIPAASYNVGVFYEQGRTVDKDLQKAFAYFMQGAQSGVVMAMQKVGTYYVNGAGCIKDPVAGAGWFARSAASGSAEGHLSYGVLTESIGTTDGGNPFLAAANSYEQAWEGAAAAIAQAKDGNHQLADALAVEAYVRLGSLHARGVMNPKDNVAKPDLTLAYVYFKQALDVNTKNNNLAKAIDEIKLTKEEKAAADSKIAAMKAALEKKINDALDKAKAAASGTPAAAATPAPAAVAVPTAPPAAAPAKGTGGKKGVK